MKETLERYNQESLYHNLMHSLVFFYFFLLFTSQSLRLCLGPTISAPDPTKSRRQVQATVVGMISK